MRRDRKTVVLGKGLEFRRVLFRSPGDGRRAWTRGLSDLRADGSACRSGRSDPQPLQAGGCEEIGRQSCWARGWSSDVCSSDLRAMVAALGLAGFRICELMDLRVAQVDLIRSRFKLVDAKRSEDSRAGQGAGVQTCALPISGRWSPRLDSRAFGSAS